MKAEWLRAAYNLALEPSDHYEGGKKMFHHRQITFQEPFGALEVGDAGYTESKMSILKNLYLHEESIAVAVEEWDIKRVKHNRYGSVGFHCYNHLMKPHLEASKLSSRHGPCLQSVILTCYRNEAHATVFYRTTELFKKFPADLILIRDHMLSRFNFELTPLKTVTFSFANMTVSPTYFGIMAANLNSPLTLLRSMKYTDPKFWIVVCRWLRNMINEEGSNMKFNQARRVSKSIQTMMSDEVRRDLIVYIDQEVPR